MDLMCVSTQVFHSYGDKNNEDLLNFYGFVEENNVHDFYTANLLQFAESQGYVSSDWAGAFAASHRAATLEKAQLRAEGWSASTLQSLRSAFEVQPGAGAGWQTEQQVLEVLQDFCKEAIASKPTTLAADISDLQSLQQGANCNARQATATQFRISTKQLLHKCALQYGSSRTATSVK